MGKGAFPGTDDRYTGMLGMHGTKVSNLGVSSCDLLIAIGTRFSDRVLGNPKTFAKKAKILQFDIDPVEVNKNVVVTSHIIGDVKEILKRINSMIDKKDNSDWMQEISELKDKYPVTYKDSGLLTGPFIVETVYDKTDGDAIITTEVGQHQMWAAQYYKYSRPRQFISSGGLGTMGYGLGASIGAKVGNPDSTVINIAGDGCFRMNFNEIITAVKEQVNVVEIIINNQVLGMVRQWQDLFYEKRYSHTVLEGDVDYVKLAEAMGANAYRATTKDEFKEAIDKALSADGPVVIDCIIDSDDKVWPMVAPGQSISKCFDENDRD